MPAPTSTAQDNQTAMAATSAGQEAVTEESKKEDEQKKSEKKVKVAKKIVKVSTPSVCWLQYCDATTGDHVITVTADFQACIEDSTLLQIVQLRTLPATAALTLA